MRDAHMKELHLHRATIGSDSERTCYRGSTSKRRRPPSKTTAARTAAETGNGRRRGEQRSKPFCGGPRGGRSWFVATAIVLLLLPPDRFCDALLLQPMPGYFLTSAILKKGAAIDRETIRIRKKKQPPAAAADIGDNDDDRDGDGDYSSSSPPTSMIRPPGPNDAASSSWTAGSDSIGTATTFVRSPPTTYVKKPTSERDILIARAAKIRQAIVKQQDELIYLERKIECCGYDGQEATMTNGIGDGRNVVLGGISTSLGSSSSLVTNLASRLARTFLASTNVALRKIDRVRKRIGPNNQQYEGRVGAYLFNELFAGLRIVSRLATEPAQIRQLVTDPRTPTLVPHAPAILARLDRLEPHVRPIIEGVLNNRQHLASIEPYLDEILERFDDIEPHLPWILENIDALAPYTGLLLKHIDALLLYANVDADAPPGERSGGGGSGSSKKKQYSLADQLLPYLEYYVSKLDTIGPHLVLLRPHVPLLLKHNRIAKVSPHIDKLFARGYETRLAASANIDVLLFWFGWTLRIPFAPAIFFALPWSPTLVSLLANHLPKKFARRGKSYCRNLECAIDADFGGAWNKLDKA